MKRLILIILLLGFLSPLLAQDPVQLDEVVVTAVNYKYLSAVDNSEAPVPIQRLEREVADFRVTDTDAYLDEYDTYLVTFTIPDGKIVAVYDKNGQIIKTIERFKNFQLPEHIYVTLKNDFPKWDIVKDVYLVTYANSKGSNKLYRIKLKNGKETIRLRVNAEGDYL
jgi:hypothetical protein